MTPTALYLLLLVGVVLLVVAAARHAPRAPGPDEYAVDPVEPEAEPKAEAEAEAEAAPAGPRYAFKGLVREQRVCQALERIYGDGFPTARPPWLRNPATGQPLEYDCYSEKHKIAAEAQGMQHYIFPNKYHRTEQEFLAQRARDEHKRRLSDAYGVYLITVPYWVPADVIDDWVDYYTPERVANRQRVEALAPPS